MTTSPIQNSYLWGLYFDEVKVAIYHFHEAAADVFVYRKGESDAKVDGKTECFRAGEVLYVPAE